MVDELDELALSVACSAQHQSQ